MKDSSQITGLKKGFIGFGILIAFLISGLIICIGSIFLYGYLFFDNSLFTTSEVSILLNSPSTLAFQTLLSNIAYICAILCVFSIFQINYKSTLSSKSFGVMQLLLSILCILSASILIDQALLSLTEGSLKFLSHRNIAGNLNMPSILGNLSETSILSFNLLLLLTIFTSPILEELFFRGFLWQTFRKDFSFLKTLLLTSTLFGFIHFDLIQGISAFFISLFYGLIAERTKSVWPCIIAHIAASYMTFLLSHKGYTFGVGGQPYPILLVATCILFAGLASFLIYKFKTKES